MDHVVEERSIDGHRVAIVEEVQDEGSEFLLVVDDVLIDGTETLDRVPGDAEIRALIRALGLD